MTLASLADKIERLEQSSGNGGIRRVNVNGSYRSNVVGSSRGPRATPIPLMDD